MAGNAFKQPCPSCEHPINIRDGSFVGKKIECPKCKYKFVVAPPKPTAGEASPGKAAPKPGATPAAKAKPKPGALRDVAEDDLVEVAADPGHSRKRLFIGLGLGGVGLVVLCLASYLILAKPNTNIPKKSAPIPNLATNNDPDPDDEPKTKAAPEVPKDKEPKTDLPKVDDARLVAPTAELTNLLPGDAEHVFHGFFKNLFDIFSPFRGAIVGDPNALADSAFSPRLGFAISDIDDFLRADRFTGAPWTFNVLHFKAIVDEKAVSGAFGLQRMPSIRGHEYFKVTKSNPWFEQLSRVAVGVPQWIRAIPRPDNGPLYVRFHNPQTVIFASEAPLVALLKADLQFPLQSGALAPPTLETKDEEPKAKTGVLPPLTTLSVENLAETVWVGAESGAKFGNIKISFLPEAKATLVTREGSMPATYEVADQQLIVTCDSMSKYTAKLVGGELKGDARLNNLVWKFSLRRAAADARIDTFDPSSKLSRPGPSRNRPYLTIKPKLKDILDRLEMKPDDGPEKPFFSAATELDPARIPANLLPPAERSKFVWRGKQAWDLTMMLDDRKPRILLAGSSLVQVDSRNYQYRAELECDQEQEARRVLRLADDTLAPELSKNALRYFNHKIEIARADGANPAGGGDTGGGRETSRWVSALRDNSVDVRIDLVFDNTALSRAQSLVKLLALSARAEVNLASDPRGRHLLGQAATAAAAKGNPDRKLPAGAFPPGAISRQADSTRGGNTPSQRLSWMTAILPYLGHEHLAHRVDYSASWREPSNWLSARTIVPEFLDPSYPETSHYVTVPGLGVAPATTHIVGIAGVGLDAADYAPDDPAFASKRGVFAYDRSATLAEIQKGRGAGNTIMMMQIPHDGLTGVSPWIAGGGATLRGVPEKNSLAPFVLTTDKNGKPLANKGRRGAYAIMADGSVRFLDASLPDNVVKALCTIQAPAPDIDFFKDERLPIVPDPAAPKSAPKSVAIPKTPPPPAAAPKLELAPPPAKDETPSDPKK